MAAMPPVPAATAPPPESCKSLRRLIRVMRPSLSLLCESNCSLGLHVEKVQALRVECEPYPVVNIRADIGLDRGHHCVGAHRHIQQDLRAELFDDLDYDVEAELDRIGSRRDVQILRTDPEGHLFPDIAAEPVRAVLRGLALHARARGPDRSVLSADLAGGKSHPRRAEATRHKEIGTL